MESGDWADELRSLSNEELAKLLVRLKGFVNATGEHLQVQEGSKIDLALGYRALRRINSIKPDWRVSGDFPLPPSLAAKDVSEPMTLAELDDLSRAELEFEALRNRAKRFSEQLSKALDDSSVGITFFRSLSEALKFSDEEISVHLDLTGAAILAWKELGGPLKQVNRKQIREWVEAHRKAAGEINLVSDRQWDRIFVDPFIAALLRH
jgi:hypothetical protein